MSCTREGLEEYKPRSTRSLEQSFVPIGRGMCSSPSRSSPHRRIDHNITPNELRSIPYWTVIRAVCEGHLLSPLTSEPSIDCQVHRWCPDNPLIDRIDSGASQAEPGIRFMEHRSSYLCEGESFAPTSSSSSSAMNIPSRNHRIRNWNVSNQQSLAAVSRAAAVPPPMSPRRTIIASVDDEDTETDYAPASRRRSSSTYVTYPSMEDIDSSETDFDVEQVFQRATFMMKQQPDQLGDIHVEPPYDIDDDPTVFCKQVMEEQSALDKLHNERKQFHHCEIEKLSLVEDYSFAAQQSCTETTYEESTIFSSDNASPTCDSEYGLSVTSSSSLTPATQSRPTIIGSSSAFAVYSPPFSSNHSHKPAAATRSPSWQESLSCADLMQEPPIQDRYASVAGRRTTSASSGSSPDRYARSGSELHSASRHGSPPRATYYPSPHTIQQQQHNNREQQQRAYYPSPQVVMQQQPRREYHHDPYLLEREPEPLPARSVARTPSSYSNSNTSHWSSRQSVRSNSHPAEQHQRKQPPRPATATAGVEIEIAPGHSMILRSSHETISAVESGYVAQLACLACETFLATVPDCQLVICPSCRFLSPVEDGDCFQNGRPGVTDNKRRLYRNGIGLGLQI